MNLKSSFLIGLGKHLSFNHLSRSPFYRIIFKKRFKTLRCLLSGTHPRMPRKWLGGTQRERNLWWTHLWIGLSSMRTLWHQFETIGPSKWCQAKRKGRKIHSWGKSRLFWTHTRKTINFKSTRKSRESKKFKTFWNPKSIKSWSLYFNLTSKLGARNQNHKFKKLSSSTSSS